jgi:hypothetical protein
MVSITDFFYIVNRPYNRTKDNCEFKLVYMMHATRNKTELHGIYDKGCEHLEWITELSQGVKRIVLRATSRQDLIPREKSRCLKDNSSENFSDIVRSKVQLKGVHACLPGRSGSSLPCLVTHFL